MAIERGKLDPSVRAHYKLPVSSATVPDINTEPDAQLWAANLADGEATRIAMGGVPLAWPDIAEVTAAAAALNLARADQTNQKTAYDQMQEAVDTQRPVVDELIKDLWDTIEYNLRHEKDHPSLRRKAREWGVAYEGDTGEEDPAAPPADPAVPPPAPQ